MWLQLLIGAKLSFHCASLAILPYASAVPAEICTLTAPRPWPPQIIA